MLALRIDLLTGRYVATSYSDRSRAEWPPHPARVFSALVAAFHAVEPPDAEERHALQWLAAQPAPAIGASIEVATRRTVPVFVPVNDVGVVADLWPQMELLEATQRELEAVRAAPSASRARDASDVKKEVARLEKRLAKERSRFEADLASALAPGVASASARDAAVAVLPEGRGRQPRTFPSVTPADPTVHLVWPEVEPTPPVRAALERLATRLTRIGHSTSLVACRLVTSPPPVDWIPSDEGGLSLRVVVAGQLERLEEEFARHREEQPRTLPSRLQFYARSSDQRSEPAAGFMGEDWIVFRRIDGPGLPTRRTPDVTAVLRAALLSHAEEPIREVLSGHKPDGRISEVPHVAFVALPFVIGPSAADGTLLGVAVVLPRILDPADRTHVLRAIGNWERSSGRRGSPGDGPPAVPLVMGLAGKLMLQRVDAAAPLVNLDAARWCRSSDSWSTVTPIALDRNPGNLRSSRAGEASEAMRRAAATVAQACVRAGLPQPLSVGLSPVSRFSAADTAVVYGPFPKQEGRFRRLLVHADLAFEQPIRGPVLVGAGRYFGLGLCLPDPRQGTRS